MLSGGPRWRICWRSAADMVAAQFNWRRWRRFTCNCWTSWVSVDQRWHCFQCVTEICQSYSQHHQWLHALAGHQLSTHDHQCLTGDSDYSLLVKQRHRHKRLITSKWRLLGWSQSQPPLSQTHSSRLSAILLPYQLQLLGHFQSALSIDGATYLWTTVFYSTLVSGCCSAVMLYCFVRFLFVGISQRIACHSLVVAVVLSLYQGILAMASSKLTANLTVLASDDPYGVYIVSTDSRLINTPSAFTGLLFSVSYVLKVQ